MTNVNNTASRNPSTAQIDSNRQTHTITVRTVVSLTKGNLFSPFYDSSGSSKTKTIQILVPTGVQKDELSQCISYSTVHGLSFELPGLFRERDGVFIPMSEIAKHPSHYEKDVLCIIRPVITSCLSPNTNYFSYILTAMCIVILGLTRMFLSSIQDLTVENFASYLFDASIGKPIRKLYRYGPMPFGWEGSPLAKICSKITYYGDETFWASNFKECETIYRSKEDSILVICRPILLIFMSVLFFKIWNKKKVRKPADTHMIETYHALNLLARQLRNAVKT